MFTFKSETEKQKFYEFVKSVQGQKIRKECFDAGLTAEKALEKCFESFRQIA